MSEQDISISFDTIVNCGTVEDVMRIEEEIKEVL